MGPLIERVEAGHVRGFEFEPEDVRVLADPLGADGLRDDDETVLRLQRIRTCAGVRPYFAATSRITGCFRRCPRARGLYASNWIRWARQYSRSSCWNRMGWNST